MIKRFCRPITARSANTLTKTRDPSIEQRETLSNPGTPPPWSEPSRGTVRLPPVDSPSKKHVVLEASTQEGATSPLSAQVCTASTASIKKGAEKSYGKKEGMILELSWDFRGV